MCSHFTELQLIPQLLRYWGGKKSSTPDFIIIYIILSEDDCNHVLCFEDKFSNEHRHWNASPSEYPQIVTIHIVKALMWTQTETSQQLTSPGEDNIPFLHTLILLRHRDTLEANNSHSCKCRLIANMVRHILLHSEAASVKLGS